MSSVDPHQDIIVALSTRLVPGKVGGTMPETSSDKVESFKQLWEAIHQEERGVCFQLRNLYAAVVATGDITNSALKLIWLSMESTSYKDTADLTSTNIFSHHGGFS